MANNTLEIQARGRPSARQHNRRWNRPVLWPVGLLLGLLVVSLWSRDTRVSCARKEQGAVTAYIIRRLLYAPPILIGVNAFHLRAVLCGQFT